MIGGKGTSTDFTEEVGRGPEGLEAICRWPTYIAYRNSTATLQLKRKDPWMDTLPYLPAMYAHTYSSY